MRCENDVRYDIHTSTTVHSLLHTRGQRIVQRARRGQPFWVDRLPVLEADIQHSSVLEDERARPVLFALPPMPTVLSPTGRDLHTFAVFLPARPLPFIIPTVRIHQAACTVPLPIGARVSRIAAIPFSRAGVRLSLAPPFSLRHAAKRLYRVRERRVAPNVPRDENR